MKLKRRRGLWIAAVAVILVLAAWSLLGEGGKASRSTFALDTYITITAYGSGAQGAVDAAVERVGQIEQMMSAFREDSQVSYINRIAAEKPAPVEPELALVLQRALTYTALTGGAFDITVEPLTRLWGITSDAPQVPTQAEIEKLLALVGSDKLGFDQQNATLAFQQSGMGIDLGGIAKGYAADEAKRILRERGVQSALIDLGGNIIAMGPRRTDLSTRIRELVTRPQTERESWTVGVQKPFAPTGECCVRVHVKDQAVVSSGAYERNFVQDGVLYHHILDPRTGKPADSGLSSVTVICSSSMDADALSTSIFVLGAERGLAIARECGADVILIDADKKIHTTLDSADVEIVDTEYVLEK